MGVRLCTAIDRVCVMKKLSKSEFNSAIPWLHALAHTHGTSCSIGKDGWSHRACIKFGGMNDGVRISVERYFDTRFLKFDFKPRDITSAAFAELDYVTAGLECGGYRSSLKNGSISYVEVTADFIGRHTSEILIFRPGVQALPQGSKKVFGTYYLGSRTSSTTTVAYNRGEHPDATVGEKAWSNLLRIEVRLRRPKIIPVELGMMKNQFTKVHVCSFETLKEVLCDDPSALHTLCACQAFGSPVAFSIYPKYRKQIMQVAAANHAPWWKPDVLMSGWGATVSRQLGMDALGVA